ncbi:hypothetical protein MYX76_04455 [Desulfobacterota bacterium AH_259_B03_O07]|nr:hypothetical protein [Desulfobacterota bacterium AH_259_B03_O07]
MKKAPKDGEFFGSLEKESVQIKSCKNSNTTPKEFQIFRKSKDKTQATLPMLSKENEKK